MRKLHIDTILKVKKLSDKSEYEYLFEMQIQLSNLSLTDPVLLKKNKHLNLLLSNYETAAIEDSHALFIIRRKVIIIQQLKQLNLTIEDLGKILHHKKDFLTLLLNGTRTFSEEDLNVIQRLLGIEKKLLFPG